VIHLSRKAEGNGPMTPWQPEMFLIIFKGANSIFTVMWGEIRQTQVLINAIGFSN